MNRGLTANEIRWAVDVSRWWPSGSEWAGALSLLVQRKEIDRIRRFAYKRDAKASLIGQLMLRKLIREALQIPNDQVNLERTERGKPYFPGSLPFCFNVSHQGAYTVLAASPSKEVGVDVMRIDVERFTCDNLDPYEKLLDFFHTMRRQFTSGEWANIRLKRESGKELEEQLGNFYRHWCLKESYVKAVGVGITMDLLSLDFNVQEPLKGIVMSTTLSVDGQLDKRWRFEEQLLDDRHCVCVALKPDSAKSEPTAFEILRVEDLTLPVHPAEEHKQWAADFEAKEEEPVFR